MAVPGAVARRTAREAEELRAQGFDPNGAPLAVQGDPATDVSATPAPAAAPATQPIEDVAALRAKIAELEAAMSTQNGRASTSSQEAELLRKQLEIVNGNRSFLESKLTEATERLGTVEGQLATLSHQATTSTVDKAVADLATAEITDKDRADFDADTMNFVERVAKRQMAVVIGPLVERLKAIEGALGRLKELDKLPQLEETARVASIDVARNRELEFIRKEVIPYYPDFETVRDTEAWKQYLGTDIPGRGIKIGRLLNTYRQSSDAEGIRSVLAGFYNKKGKLTLDSLVVPAKTNADVAPTGTPVKMKASEYKQNLRDFTSKRLPQADWTAYRARWDAAMTAGNIEMDVELK